MSGKEEKRRNPDGFQAFLTQFRRKIFRQDACGGYWYSFLKTAIADGKGLEVNTSSHRYGLTDSMPSTDLLRLYRDLGGSIVTIGSDSHSPAHLGTYLQEAEEQLQALGFRHYCTYHEMQPVFHNL